MEREERWIEKREEEDMGDMCREERNVKREETGIEKRDG